jgi:Protein of unknown function (DUF3027)
MEAMSPATSIDSARIASGKPDAVCASAVDVARQAAVDVGGESVGAHLAVHADGDRVVTHAFAAFVPGYVGWFWSVSVTRVPRSKAVTVDEVVLLPGPDALLAPPWLPWSARVRPGDLSPGDVLPVDPDDPRVVPAFLSTDDTTGDLDDTAGVAFELGLGRARVLSRDGRIEAADRWRAGDAGPESPMARNAPAHCGTCAFCLPVSGSLRAAFGVCSNEISPADGRVVSVEYGCGAHSDAGLVTAP